MSKEKEATEEVAKEDVAAKADKAPAEAGTELVAAKSNEVALSEDDGFFETDSSGLEDFSQSDFTIPFLGILQALSKPLIKGNAKYVAGAQQGMLLNSATRKLYDGEAGIIVVPVMFQHRYIAWKPNNGGIAHDYGQDATVYNSLTPNEKFKRVDADGNEVVDTMEYFCFIVDEETGVYEPAVLGFSGVFSKKAKQWNNLIRMHTEMHQGKVVRPAIFFYAYKLTTVPESNEKGMWYAHNLEDYKKVKDLPNGAELFREAKALRASIKAGEVKAAVNEDHVEGGPDDGDEETPF